MKADDGKEFYCEECEGYGYTEAVSMSWTDSDFEEYACKQCSQEQEEEY